MQTVLNWHNPDETPPPFGERILIATRTWDLPSSNRPPVWNFDVVTMTKQSINDDAPKSEYAAWESGSEYPFSQYQFLLRSQNGDEIDGFFSDSIVFWSELPVLEAA